MSYDEAETVDDEVAKPKRSRKKKADKKDTPQYFAKKICEAEKEGSRWLRQARDADHNYAFKQAFRNEYQWEMAGNQHFPLFWSNIQTLMPQLYSRTPIPMSKRRFDDNEPVGKLSSFIQERLARYLVGTTPYDQVMRRVVRDLLIAAKGNARVYYKAKFKKPDRVDLAEGMPLPEGKEVLVDEHGKQYYLDDPFVDSESIEVSWVPYDSFVHNAGARCWQDVWFESFDQFYDKYEFEEEFGDKYVDKVPFSHVKGGARGDVDGDPASDDAANVPRFARVCEVWNKRTRKVGWLCPDAPQFWLKAPEDADDIYELREFWPNPEPLLGTVSDDNIQPIPDYIQYRNSLMMLDFLFNRQQRLIKALRPHGVYDASVQELSRLASETSDADLVPIENFKELYEKGGIDAVIAYADKSKLAAALIQTYEAIDRQKQYIYEITGIADVLRGQTDPNETLGAQNLKQQNAQTRLSDTRREVQRFARDLAEIMTDLALARFSDDTIWAMTGMEFQPENIKAMFLPALAILRNDTFRNFRIEFETDATVAVDDAAEKEANIEFLNALTQFIPQLAQVQATLPAMLPAMAEALGMVVRSMRQSATAEETLMQGFQQLINPPPPTEPPPPDPEMLKVQLEQQKVGVEEQKVHMKGQELALKAQESQMKMHGEAAKQGTEAQLAAAQLALEQQRIELEKQKQQIELMKALLDNETKKTVESEKVSASLINAAIPKVEKSPVGPVVRRQ